LDKSLQQLELTVFIYCPPVWRMRVSLCTSCLLWWSQELWLVTLPLSGTASLLTHRSGRRWETSSVVCTPAWLTKEMQVQCGLDSSFLVVYIAFYVF